MKLHILIEDNDISSLQLYSILNNISPSDCARIAQLEVDEDIDLGCGVVALRSE